MIISGTGIGQIRTIASNTATAITVTSAWTIQPDTTSIFIVSTAQEIGALTAVSKWLWVYGNKISDSTVLATLNNFWNNNLTVFNIATMPVVEQAPQNIPYISGTVIPQGTAIWNSIISGPAPSVPVLSSKVQVAGPLITGSTYYIALYEATDDFANVGGTNVTGNIFVASGTTPTTYTNASILIRIR
jgi:hypothetical protein